ncbi:DUF3857 domain-containing protein [Bacteriovorax sp. DB6_IX]|uniref:DUF3857 domain-containing protein n=1 Tax=Bacteriovorax sp. DB6_IX TaxID=1353530 RepID=UPI00038A1ACA|nr:DUF3857 domain-containing protein [Bacteriovorax sp. DB6_IX]EQC51486.1 PF12969 structural domain protein [Bacteriovorax sp. DB6_IX]
MKNLILKILLISISLPIFAKKATLDDLAYYYLMNNSKVELKDDGSYKEDNHIKIKVLKEYGVEQLKLFQIPFLKDKEEIKITSISVINNEKSHLVDSSKFKEKSYADSGQGISNVAVLLIPLPHLKKESVIDIRYTKKSSGTKSKDFFLDLTYGARVFEKESHTQIKSRRKLFVQKLDPTNSISLSQIKKGEFYYTSIKLTKPVLNIPVNDIFVVLDKEQKHEVAISTVGDWKTISHRLSREYEKLLKGKLPLKLQELKKQALKLKTVEEQVDLILNYISKNYNYLGIWTNDLERFFPLSLEEIVADGYGDCKSFSLIFTKMMRELGHKSYLSLVYRGNPLDKGMEIEKIARLSFFNHAISLLEVDGKKYWIDPTNKVSYGLVWREDISNRKALVLKKETTELDYIQEHPANRVTLELNKEYDFIDLKNAKVEGKIKISGLSWLKVNEFSSYYPEQKEKMITKLIKGIDNVEVSNIQNLNQDEGLQKKHRESYSFSHISSFPLLDKQSETLILNNPIFVRTLLKTNTSGDFGKFLGQKGKYVETYRLKNIEVYDKSIQNCEINSTWLDFKLISTFKDGVLNLTRKMSFKQSYISSNTIHSDDFKSFVDKLNSCAREKVLTFAAKGADIKSNGNVGIDTMTIGQRYELANELFLKGHYSEKLDKLVASILAEDPDHYGALILKAHEEYQNSVTWTGIDKFRFKNVIKLAMLAKEVEPRDYKWLRMMVLAKSSLGEESFDQVMKYFKEESAKLETTPNKINGMIGDIYFNFKKYKESLKFYQDAANQSVLPHDIVSFSLSLGNAALKAKMYPTADKAFKKCVLLSDDRQDCWRLWSLVKIAQKDYERAIEYARKTFQIKSNGYAKTSVQRAYVAKINAISKPAKRNLGQIQALYDELFMMNKNENVILAYAETLLKYRKFKESKVEFEKLYKMTDHQFYIRRANQGILKVLMKTKNDKGFGKLISTMFEKSVSLVDKRNALFDIEKVVSRRDKYLLNEDLWKEIEKVEKLIGRDYDYFLIRLLGKIYYSKFRKGNKSLDDLNKARTYTNLILLDPTLSKRVVRVIISLFSS